MSVESKPGSGVVEFEWLGATRIASFPSLPTCVALSQAAQAAMGIVWAKNDEGKSVAAIDPATASNSELQLVWAALLGLLLGDVDAPSFAAQRRDVLRYGEAVLDALIRAHGLRAMVELTKIGTDLLAAMDRDSASFWVEVEGNKGK